MCVNNRKADRFWSDCHRVSQLGGVGRLPMRDDCLSPNTFRHAESLLQLQRSSQLAPSVGLKNQHSANTEACEPIPTKRYRRSGATSMSGWRKLSPNLSARSGDQPCAAMNQLVPHSS